MTIFTNTFLTFSQKGIKEQLADIIYNISPTDTPFMSSIGKGKATNTFFEWQTDSLASAAANAQLEGDDITSISAVTASTRIGNYAQISYKTGVISGTAQAVNLAGRANELKYQIAKRGAELKRDQEFAICQNTTYVAGNSTTARQTRGLEGWCATNNSLGASGVAPVAGATNTAPTDGTQRDITESMLKDLAQKCFTAGGNPNMLMCGPVNKQKISAFTGNATSTIDRADGELQAAIDIYYSDFGKLKIVPNRFQRERTAFVIQTDMWKLNVLRSYEPKELAKTGDADKFLLTVEYGLQSNQEAASGAIRDLTTT
jgi:hypothetical protein